MCDFPYITVGLEHPGVHLIRKLNFIYMYFPTELHDKLDMRISSEVILIACLKLFIFILFMCM